MGGSFHGYVTNNPISISGLCHPSQCGLVAAHSATAAVLGTTGGGFGPAG